MAIRIDIDGQPADAVPAALLADASYGHFTSMQVRARRVRGLGLHLARLDAAHREIVGTGLAGDRVRDLVRQALGDTADASVRVLVFCPEPGEEPSVAVTVRPPGEMPATPQRLRSVPYLRPAAHLKHIGDFGQTYYRRLVIGDGYDDALLTGPAGEIAETGIANLGFSDGATVTWPDAPQLAGITMQLVEPRLASHRRPVYLADVPALGAAFVTNSRGIAAVAQIDDWKLPVDNALMAHLHGVYDSVPWDAI